MNNQEIQMNLQSSITSTEKNIEINGSSGSRPKSPQGSKPVTFADLVKLLSQHRNETFDQFHGELDSIRKEFYQRLPSNNQANSNQQVLQYENTITSAQPYDKHQQQVNLHHSSIKHFGVQNIDLPEIINDRKYGEIDFYQMKRNHEKLIRMRKNLNVHKLYTEKKTAPPHLFYHCFPTPNPNFDDDYRNQYNGIILNAQQEIIKLKTPFYEDKILSLESQINQ
jgi:hypothetical protein